MKYGMRERVSGAVILLALGVIFIPMLFDKPPARDARPEPVMTIEQPIDVEQDAVQKPAPPSSLGQIQSPEVTNPQPDSAAVDQDDAPAASGEQQSMSTDESRQVTQQASSNPDPIAELAKRANQNDRAEASSGDDGTSSSPEPTSNTPAVTEGGNWAVQVGSFGKPANAERLETKLNEQGFHAYRRPRDNNLTSVYVGPFASSDDGEQARTALKEQANIQGLLIRVQEGE